MGNTAPPPAMLTVEEAAAYLRIGRSKAYQMVASGLLPSMRMGGLLRIPRGALEKWITDQTKGG